MERLRTYAQAHWRWLLFLAFPLISLAMHLHLLDRPLQGVHAWRQCETASNVVLFAEGDADLFSPHVYSLEWKDGLKRMEFPIMQWLMGMVVRLVGHETLVMRLLSWLIAMATMLGFFKVCHLLFRDCLVALMGAWCWLFSPLLFYYGINPLPDNFSLMLAVWGMAAFLQWFRGEGQWRLLVSLVFLSLSVATKLPFIVFFALPFGGLLQQLIAARGKTWARFFGMGALGMLILAPAVAWYAWVIPQWTGNGVIKGVLDMTSEEVPEMVGNLSHNLFSTLPELMINYAALGFFVWGVVRLVRDRLYKHALAWPFGLLALATGAYFVFEINMITTVHDYYLFPFMPEIFVLIGLGLQGLVRLRQGWIGWAIVVLLIALPITAGLRTYSRWNDKGLEPLLSNIDALRAAVPADARIIVGHDLSPHISLFHLRHSGWTVAKGNIDPLKVADYFAQGATYLYSNDIAIETNPAVMLHLDKLVGKWGGYRVTKLK